MKIGFSSKTIISFLVIFLLVCMFSFNGLAQELRWDKRSLTRGKVWLTMCNSLQYNDGPISMQQYYNLDYPGYSPQGEMTRSYLESGGYMIYGKRGSKEHAYTISTMFGTSSRYVSPLENSELTKNYNMKDSNIPAEEIVTGSHFVKALAVEVGHKSMVWSYPKYDDFVIHEYTITNPDTSSTNIESLYFGVRLGIWITQKGTYDGSGQGWVQWHYDDKYGWNDEHDCFYFYDGRSFEWENPDIPVAFNFGPGPETGDFADPADIEEKNIKVHELYSAGSMTCLCLDSRDGNVYRNILQYRGQGTNTDAPMIDRMVYMGTDEASRYKEVMTREQPQSSWDELHAAGGDDGSKYERMPQYLVSCGPYDLVPGESIKLVFAEVLGEMDRQKIVEGGVENIELLPDASKDSLLKNVQACRELYNKNGKNYRIEDHPPMTPTNGENSLDITVPDSGGVVIKWPKIPETYSDPITGLNDFAGYRVYRSYNFCIGPWELVHDIPKGEAVIDDDGNVVLYSKKGIYPGVGLYYCATSYDEEGNESGKVNANRFPIYSKRPSNTEFPKKVYVVPNPFRQHSGLMGANEARRIQFVGLPAKCTIRIYTPVGELIKTIEHDDGSDSEAWGSIRDLDYQTSKWMQSVQPGMYIYHVESLVEGQKEKSYIGKFAIIK